MSSKLSLTFFQTRSESGTHLQELFLPLAEELGFRVKLVGNNRSPMIYSQACANDDVVVVDASIEKVDRHNYDIITSYPIDHLLVVSRNYLPFNFYGTREEIWDDDQQTYIYGTAFYGQEIDNYDILKWLELQLKDLISTLPRPSSQRGGPLALTRAMKPSLDKQDARRNRSGEVFISYRSKEHYDVERLKRQLENGYFSSDLPRMRVRYFPPGMLSDEVMTEQRRWQILSMLDRFIGSASEVWIYETDDYYNSWWTLGELLILSYRQVENFRGRKPPKLRVFSPYEWSVQDASRNFLPKITKEQMKRRARLFATTDTSTGLELSAGIGSASRNSILGFLPYFRDHVWTEEFWKYPIIDCGACRSIGNAKNRFNIDDFLTSNDPGINRLSPQNLTAAIIDGKISCPNCGTSYDLEAAPPHYLYIGNMGLPTTKLFKAWIDIYGLQPTDSQERNLLCLPVYRLR